MQKMLYEQIMLLLLHIENELQNWFGILEHSVVHYLLENKY